MAAFEKPLNQIDFGAGEKPKTMRAEEEYMHKYFEMKPPKISKKTAEEDHMNSEGEDPELDAFADQAIEDKMKELNQGQGIDDEDDESLDIQYSEEDEDDNLAAGDSDAEEGEEQDDDFFD